MSKTKGGGSQNWRTPRSFFDRLVRRFGPFYLDVCASRENALCADYFTAENSALERPWPTGINVFCNPPFSMMREFLAAARAHAVSDHSIVVVLGPMDCGVKWFRELVWGQAHEVILLTPRVNYIPPEGVKASSATGASAAYVFMPGPAPTSPEFSMLRWR